MIASVFTRWGAPPTPITFTLLPRETSKPAYVPTSFDRHIAQWVALQGLPVFKLSETVVRVLGEPMGRC